MMATKSGKPRHGRFTPIDHQSNRRAAARHFCEAYLTLPLAVEPGDVPAPGYLLN
jgi:hypothetical protein